ncbi:MAG: hypothetical protein COX96_06490 [Candidatus Omnitrophica bacterium CG_4_10_14_0_2_um_filter_44_9]|nr:MAG: hypothetical protein COY78_08730 [Candidatus Omnitrophica bacterium CG_4_10_14_0_8_um_filter_44_12]PIZ83874.1 MAG: hypothetical protein COX96_06490 [Candidatus Omnitrophica bacterium CG_4_10_14_0_2_um_filter_44_9]
MKKIMIVMILFVSISIFFCACSHEAATKGKTAAIQITDIKMAAGINDDLMPVKTTDTFPKGSSKVYCWFKWRNAKVNTAILVKWEFVTDEIPILDNVVAIPRKEGMGGVSLVMPEGKALPSGEYRIGLILEGRPLKSYSFKVE